MKKLSIFCHKIIFLLSLLGVVFNSPIIHKVYANDWQKYPNNPTFSENTNNWDSYHVHNPNINIIGNYYAMWYEGNGGSGWKIGFASSPDGITSWEREQNPIFISGIENQQYGDPNIIILSSNQYHLFYTWY